MGMGLGTGIELDTVEPPYCRHHWNRLKTFCVLIIEVSTFQR